MVIGKVTEGGGRVRVVIGRGRLGGRSEGK